MYHRSDRDMINRVFLEAVSPAMAFGCADLFQTACDISGLRGSDAKVIKPSTAAQRG
jgi:hypothetical protein